jgi:hypothetical protein
MPELDSVRGVAVLMVMFNLSSWALLAGAVVTILVSPLLRWISFQLASTKE